MASQPQYAECLVLLPTYNEALNIETAVAAVRAAVPGAQILVIDDSSPDGTGEIADRLAESDDRLAVLHRLEKDGLGRAYLAGFAWGLERGFAVVIEMDADGSHPADRLPAMIDALRRDPSLGLVIGSRWVPGGSVVDWPKRREWLSRTANWFAGAALRVPVEDITAGFRAFRASALRQLDLADVESRGYCFQIDLTLRVLDGGYGVREVPIRFVERQHGHSKMSGGIIWEAMVNVLRWGVARRSRRAL